MKRYVLILIVIAFGVAGNMDYQDQLYKKCKSIQPDNIPACVEKLQ